MTLSEFERLRHRIDDAIRWGFILKSDHRRGGCSAVLDPEVWVGAAEDVIVYNSEHVEDVLRFIEGAAWAHEFLRISNASKN